MQTTKLKMLCSVNLLAIVILAMLPYISTLTLPSGDPAPGRSPGPPDVEETTVAVTDVEYDETTVEDVTTVSAEVTVSACAFARIPSESDEVVTISDKDSEVNLTVSHAVFETDQLVRGVVYDGECFVDFHYRNIRI